MNEKINRVLISKSGADPGYPVEGVDPRRGRFSVKMYVKTKELGPVGGGGRAPEKFCM